MTKYKKKSVVVEATQWFKNGDHPKDECRTVIPPDNEGSFLSEGKVVRRYRNPNVDSGKVCNQCGHTMHEHGWIDTLEGGHIVCVRDFIITGTKGENYPCKPDIFYEIYEPYITGEDDGATDSEE